MHIYTLHTYAFVVTCGGVMVSHRNRLSVQKKSTDKEIVRDWREILTSVYVSTSILNDHSCHLAKIIFQGLCIG